ncbi:tRNA(fMet)-specific endonuclease VapC [Alicycliphilus denitrificans]|uniref:type II toxin-antitoxin system tRNA(fMet)-specific endonuclease VapC n=1 Tax=Alicycliphilus denitrificans TaxID=179636 RepID=UPI000AB78A25|nr:type II toxin-antitoxin system VapC family toxin [Alicycliphilus denitrificans]BCN40539.1 tRNA(fMet)-specific endonuclease VapC [Alicycliphilus denitrificans]
MRYMLDTNICIYVINQRPAHVLPIFNAHHSQMCISEITRFELLSGAYKSKAPHKALYDISTFCAMLDVLPLDAAACDHAAQIRAMLEQKGQKIGPFDTLIAGHARSLAAILVTNNVREFERVGSLMIEDWTQG